MQNLSCNALIHLSFFLTNTEKCILYESTEMIQNEILIRITEIFQSHKINDKILNNSRFCFLESINVGFGRCFKINLNKFGRTLKNIIIICYHNKKHKYYDRDISQLLFLERIHIQQNKIITNLNTFQFLKEINVSGENSIITDKEISQLKLLKKINANDNKNIKNLNCFPDLTEIDISFNCGVTDEGISQLKFLTKINVSNNSKITNLNRFKNTLKELIIQFSYGGITNAGISELLHLQKINMMSNKQITTLIQF